MTVKKFIAEILPGDILRDPAINEKIMIILSVEHLHDSAGNIARIQFRCMRTAPYELFSWTASNILKELIVINDV